MLWYEHVSREAFYGQGKKKTTGSVGGLFARKHDCAVDLSGRDFLGGAVFGERCSAGRHDASCDGRTVHGGFSGGRFAGERKYNDGDFVGFGAECAGLFWNPGSGGNGLLASDFLERKWWDPDGLRNGGRCVGWGLGEAWKEKEETGEDSWGRWEDSFVKFNKNKICQEMVGGT